MLLGALALGVFLGGCGRQQAAPRNSPSAPDAATTVGSEVSAPWKFLRLEDDGMRIRVIAFVAPNCYPFSRLLIDESVPSQVIVTSLLRVERGGIVQGHPEARYCQDPEVFLEASAILDHPLGSRSLVHAPLLSPYPQSWGDPESIDWPSSAPETWPPTAPEPSPTT